MRMCWPDMLYSCNTEMNEDEENGYSGGTHKYDTLHELELKISV